jgi:UDP-N-acetylmuramate dehydrogenase
MDLLENISLKPFNTFGIDAHAKYFTGFSSAGELQSLLSDPVVRNSRKLILGGGSNILLTRDFEGVVLKNNITGISLESENDKEVILKCGAGEVWHQFVTYCVDRGWGGVENLSLIPGNVGASPMQNIGAYGVEMKEVFEELEAVEIGTGSTKTFTKAECRFGYRESIFKNEARDKYIIVSVSFRLSKHPVPNTSYGAIEAELKAMGVTDPDIKAVSQAVCNIRRSKLPDPAKIGNAGSFFKNPEVSEDFFNRLKEKFPDLVGYRTAKGVKLAAGWLIEQCGWKGRQIGQAGVHKNQALVLVNYGQARGSEVLDLAKKVKDSVSEKFGVDLEMEVNII